MGHVCVPLTGPVSPKREDEQEAHRATCSSGWDLVGSIKGPVKAEKEEELVSAKQEPHR